MFQLVIITRHGHMSHSKTLLQLVKIDIFRGSGRVLWPSPDKFVLLYWQNPDVFCFIVNKTQIQLFFTLLQEINLVGINNTMANFTTKQGFYYYVYIHATNSSFFLFLVSRLHKSVSQRQHSLPSDWICVGSSSSVCRF